MKGEVERLKSQRNEYSKAIGEAKKKGESAEKALKEVAEISDKIHHLDHELSGVEAEFFTALSVLPNLPKEEIKDSPDPKDNVMIKSVGKKPEFSFPFKNHVELNEKLHLFDFERAARLSGSGWPIYKGIGARLEWALIQYMVSKQIENGYQFMLVPHLIRKEGMFGTGQLPKFETQLFQVKDEDYHLYLIPTAEASLNGLHLGEILEGDELPLKYTSYTPCFRREAGAAGSQERGLIRMHQFNKVELFVFSKPEESDQMFEEMLKAAESVLEGLELHYRNMLLVTGDMSYGSAKTVDIEVYLPGQNRYYEVSSVSNCTDFQARRSDTRFRREPGSKPEFVHTLNGSGLATSRLMVAILENNQQPDGSVIIPKVLRPYLGNLEKLTPRL